MPKLARTLALAAMLAVMSLAPVTAVAETHATGRARPPARLADPGAGRVGFPGTGRRSGRAGRPARQPPPRRRADGLTTAWSWAGRRSAAGRRLGEARPAGGLDHGEHGPDVVVGGVVDRAAQPLAHPLGQEPVHRRHVGGQEVANRNRPPPRPVLMPWPRTGSRSPGSARRRWRPAPRPRRCRPARRRSTAPRHGAGA